MSFPTTHPAVTLSGHNANCPVPVMAGRLFTRFGSINSVGRERLAEGTSNRLSRLSL
jgi:hypothetical protein